MYNLLLNEDIAYDNRAFKVYRYEGHEFVVLEVYNCNIDDMSAEEIFDAIKEIPEDSRGVVRIDSHDGKAQLDGSWTVINAALKSILITMAEAQRSRREEEKQQALQQAIDVKVQHALKVLAEHSPDLLVDKDK